MKTRVFFMRHGLTAGNREARYTGRTDEPLCSEGIAGVLSSGLREVISSPELEGELSFAVSPMIRCLQSAALLLGADACMVSEPEKVREVLSRLAKGRTLIVDEGLRECDFGRFEGKNYRELSGDIDYQKWIDSNGLLAFPGGESPGDFKRRCCDAFVRIASRLDGPAVFVVHGGTIMSILEKYGRDYDGKKKTFYDWHIGSGGVYEAELAKGEGGAPALLSVKRVF